MISRLQADFGFTFGELPLLARVFFSDACKQGFQISNIQITENQISKSANLIIC
jgi:hypothetical protein